MILVSSPMLPFRLVLQGFTSLPCVISIRTYSKQNNSRFSGLAINAQRSPFSNLWRSPYFAAPSHSCQTTSTKVERHEDSGLLLHDPKKGDLVYYGPMGGRVRGLKLLSVSSSLTCMGLFPYLFLRADNLPLFLQATCGLLSGFFIFLQPMIIHWLVYRYVIALYYDRQTKTFTVTTMTFFGTKKDMKFTKEDIERVEIPTLFERVRVKDRPLYMENDYFLDIAAFRIIMNYESSEQNKRH